MAIQVNLLPDIKQQRLRADRLKQIVISSAAAVLVAAVAIPILLFIVNQGLKLAEGRVQGQINERKEHIRNFPDINTMLTVQKNLNALPDLYRQRVYASELLGVLPKLTPAIIRFTNVEISADGSIQIIGVAPNFQSVQKFHTALLNSGLDIKPDSVDPNPNTSGDFTNVVLESVSGDAGEISFTISTQFSPQLLNGKKN